MIKSVLIAVILCLLVSGFGRRQDESRGGESAERLGHYRYGDVAAYHGAD